MKFYQWYTEALGSVMGMIFCIYCYLNGSLLLYSNLIGNYDALTFSEVIASYTLYPLCILTLIFSFITSIYPTCENKKILGIRINKINFFFKYLTVIVGILGCSIYFIVPSLFILFSDIALFINHIIKKLHRSRNFTPKKEIVNKREVELNPILNIPDISKQNDDKIQSLATKTEIAIYLLNKDANMEFIKEITGLSWQYLNKLKKEALNPPK